MCHSNNIIIIDNLCYEPRYVRHNTCPEKKSIIKLIMSVIHKIFKCYCRNYYSTQYLNDHHVSGLL